MSPSDVATALQKRIRQLSELGDDPFDKALADSISNGRDRLSAAAFRSPELCYRSFNRTEFIIRQVEMRLNEQRRANQQRMSAGERIEQGQHWREAQLTFRNKVIAERQFLRPLVAAERARRTGTHSPAPNPTKRAQERLWQLALQGPVPEGTASRLLQEERDLDEANRIAARRAALGVRQGRRDERTGRGPTPR